MKSIRIDLIAILVFVSVVAIFFYPVATGKIPAPTDALVGLYHPWRDLYASQYPRGIPFKNFLITDPVRQQIPWRKTAIDLWKERTLPRWNPYNFSGTPLAGNIQAGVFYPFNIIFLLLDFPIAWTLLIMLQPLFAGLFFYLYCRSRWLDPLASVVGSLAWSFSGVSIAWLTWGTIGHVTLWYPLILLSIDKLIDASQRFDRQVLLWAMTLTASLTLMILAGHVQFALYGLFLGCVYAFWRMRNTTGHRKRTFFMLLFPHILAAGLTTVAWYPMVATVLQSSRIAVSEVHQVGWFLPWQHLVQFVVPDFFGNPATGNYWGVWNYGEFVGYIGIIPFLFALYGMFFETSKDRRLWGVVGGASLFLSLPTPLGTLLYDHGLPFISSLQPSRHIVLVDFALSMFAAYGVQKWFKTRDMKSSIQVIAPLAIAFLIIWSRARLGFASAQSQELKLNWLVSERNIIVPMLVFLIAAAGFLMGVLFKNSKKVMLGVTVGFVVLLSWDLLRFGSKFTPFTPSAYFFPTTTAIKYLMSQKQPFRVVSTDPKLFPPNVSAYYGIESIDGYDPIVSDRYESFMAALGRKKPDIAKPYGFNRIVSTETIDSPLVRLMNVRYLLTLKEFGDPRVTLAHQEGETRVYEFLNALPRTYLVNSLLKAKSLQGTIELLYDQSFDPHAAAVVEDDIDIPNLPMDQSENVVMDSYAGSRINMNMTTIADRFLVIANTYDPGWRVLVDDVQVPIYRTNYIFFGARVPSGFHRISVQYH